MSSVVSAIPYVLMTPAMREASWRDITRASPQPLDGFYLQLMGRRPPRPVVRASLKNAFNKAMKDILPPTIQIKLHELPASQTRYPSAQHFIPLPIWVEAREESADVFTAYHLEDDKAPSFTWPRSAAVAAMAPEPRG